MLLFGLCFALCLLTPATGNLGVNLWTNPKVVEQSITKQLTVNCSVVQTTNSSIARAITLFVYKSSMRNPNVYQDVAVRDSLSGQIKPAFSLNGTLSGGLKIDGSDSYLAIQWSYPQFELTGNFKCELTGLDALGHTVTVDAVQSVTDATPDLAAALREIQSQDSRIASLESAMTSLNLRLDAFDNTLFYSTVMENRTKYMVSRPFLLNTAIAESLCQLYGGYLVEINDGHEYTVVKRVLEGAKANDDVLVGVTDEFQEGVWRYREHKTQTVTFLLWDNSKPEPDGGAAENCATLGADVGWKLQDRKCYDNTAHVRFMCEVENA